MSTVEYHVCDVCGDLIVNDVNMGFFQDTVWLGGEKGFELCSKCCDEVREFILEKKEETGRCN